MSTKFFNDQWRMPRNANQNKQSNYSMDFNGVSSTYVDLGIITEINGLSNFSFSVWIKPVSPLGGTQGIVFGNRDINNSYKGIAFALHGPSLTGTSFVYLETNLLPIPTGTFTFNQWSHVVITYDNATFAIYVDNSLINSVSLANQSLTSTAAFNIGRDVAIGTAKDFNGQIDEFAIFNRALDSTEIATLYGSSSTGIGNPMSLSPKPVAYYQLGDESVDNGADYLVPNSSLKDYVFNFNTDYVTLNSSINLTGNKTVSYWVNPITLNGNVYIGGVSPDYYTYMSSTQLAIKDSTGFSSFTISISTGNWYHICITGDGTNATLYINGDTIGTVADKNPTIDTIGAYSGGGGGPHTDMSNVQIFNTTLPATGSNSVETLYNNGSPLTSMSGFTSLQGWWKLDATETYNSSYPGNWTITDHSSNSNTGTSGGMTQANLVQSDLSFTNGYSPYALDFDGVNDYINVGNLTSINGLQKVTYSFWMNDSSGVASYPIGTDGQLVLMPLTNSNRFDVNLAGSRIYTNLQPSTVLNTNQWYHISVVIDSTLSAAEQRTKLYIDGTAYLDVSGTAITQNATIGTVATDTNIGRASGSVPAYFNGKISNVSIWNTNLTSSQVTEIYNESVPSDLNNHSAYSNLVNWWQLGSNSGFNAATSQWTVLDEKGTSNGVSSANMANDDIVNGVGYTGNGLGDTAIDIVGDAPYSEANSISVNIDASDRVIDVPAFPTLTVDFLVIAGGAGGGPDSGSGWGGGGGAGGYRNSYNNETSGGNSASETALSVPASTNVIVTVGEGGNGAITTNSGEDSVFYTITSIGGGGGGSNGIGAVGGSGGGNGTNGPNPPAAALGTANQGFGGGINDGSWTGGGGGAGQIGGVNTGVLRMEGGDGLSSSITGTAVTRAGGGGGIQSGFPGPGGTGGGGNGGQPGTDGVTNTGSAGGAGGPGGAAGGDGGSGIVILRYPSSNTITVGAGLTASTSTIGGDNVTIFTAGTGSISIA